MDDTGEPAPSWWRGTERCLIAPLPEDAVPPYFVIAPVDVVLKKAMKSIGWPRTSAYGPYLAPDGNTVNIVYSRVMIERAQTDCRSKDGPFGTVLVVWGEGNFHKDRQRLLDRIMSDARWIVRDLPEKPKKERGIKRGTAP